MVSFAQDGFPIVVDVQYCFPTIIQITVARCESVVGEVKMSTGKLGLPPIAMIGNWLHRAGMILLAGIIVCGASSGPATAKTAADASANYFVGVAKLDITPDYPVRLNGFGGRREESEGITQSIWAKALAISATEQSQPLVLVTLDSLGIRWNMVEEVAARLERQVGLPREQLAVTFTHSHTTPKVNGASDTIFSTPIPAEHQRHIDRYTEQLTDAIEKVALAAIADRQPSRLEWGVGKVDFAVNRRTAGGPVDHDLPMLVVRAPNNQVRAIYVTYACHCVTLSHNKISGDWAGYAQEAIERSIPGAIALVSIGCGSDSNPNSGVTGENFAVAAEQGGAIQREVERLLNTPLRPIRGEPAAKLAQIDLPLNTPPSKEQLEQLAAQGGPAGYNAQWQLEQLAQGHSLLEKIEYPIQTWSFGDSLAMVFLAGEVCVDYSLRLKQDFDPQRIWLHGYSNDFCAYIPSERLLNEGGYGGGAETVYFALPATFQPGLEQQVIDEVHRQVPLEFARVADPQRTQGSRAKTPAESLATLQTHPDLRVELVAAEPLVIDPVAIDFGADGRLWVAEMRDYPSGVKGNYEPGGVVKLLSDTDGDGQYDHAEVFLDGIPFPTGLMAWRQGVLVCAAPDILYAEDTDGDGKADVVEKRFQGFATHNYQARVNSLRYGLDNWVYAAAGLFGGNITTLNGHHVDLTNRDFRMLPDQQLLEAVSGNTQQSRVRDDWGNWFGCDNGTLIRQYPLSDHYLTRNPHVAPPDPSIWVAPSNELFPPGELVSFALSGPPGRATAACGVDLYRDIQLGEEYRHNSFTCEPVNQLVHRLVLEPAGTFFRGTRAPSEQTSEFLTSTDNWFRPVQARTGPDGALWIVDMYRYVIEHPRWIPEQTLAQLDVRAGDRMGRIYRVVRQDNRRPPVVRFDHLSLPQLVASLNHPNGTQRDLVQQHLVWNNDPACVPLLRTLAREATLPEGRLHAICTLDGLHALDSELLIHACHDPHPGVRRHAVRLAEPYLNVQPELLEAVLALVDDQDVLVRMQLAYSLGTSRDPRSHTVLLRLARQEAGDAYFLAAVYSSIHQENIRRIIAALLELPSRSANEQAMLEKLIEIVVALNDPAMLSEVTTKLSNLKNQPVQTWQLAAAATLSEALNRQAAQQATVLPQPDWTALLSSAMELVQDTNAALIDRLAAVRLLVSVSPHRAIDDGLLPALLSPKYPPEIQLAVVDAMTKRAHDSVPGLFITRWPEHSPALRHRMLDALLSRLTWTDRLLDAIQDAVITPSDIDPTRRQQLMFHTNPEIAKRARVLFDTVPNENFTALIETYRQGLDTTSDIHRGREVFRKTCAVCHRLEDYGDAVGPDLAALTSRDRNGLLVDILDPNRAVDARYRNYVAATVDGETLQGILANETATSVTLLAQEGKRRVILRDDLEELHATPLSLMPEGLHKEIPVDDMRHLLGYLESTGARPKQIEGNRPRVLAPNDNNIACLPASAAAIYGNDITFEIPFQNIGYWHGQQDHVVWQFAPQQEQDWDVYLDWACADDSAGNAFVLQTATMSLQGVVATTGGYDKYQQIKIGSIHLKAGTQRIVLLPAGPLTRPNLMDCRALYLVPSGSRWQLPEPPSKSAVDPPTADQIQSIAALIVATDTADQRRSELLEQYRAFSVELIREMAPPTIVDTTEEYRRIPWLWTLAIHAGRRNDPTELRRLLELALPQPDTTLAHWQAVVVGGGIINGLSQSGTWPKQRLEELMTEDTLALRWQETLAAAYRMADNEDVPIGTRYDALRLVGMDAWKDCQPVLARYLAMKDHPELQMGAVSSLADIPETEATGMLIQVLNDLQGENLRLALAGLVRNDDRANSLLDAIQRKSIEVTLLNDATRTALLESQNAEIRMRARRVLEP
jgi:putative membrane-bound dehydrogenase-like protein